ncbi:hypothetical protein HED60_02860 [Planctomycetales bacterium ZRK34]|nr:hypothetical protein HED60_02860 [Planctomycetales bacterium ZRK34]
MIDRFRRHVWARLGLRGAVGAVSLWLFVWGTVVLISRAAVGVERLPLAWGGVGVLVAIIGAYAVARRRVPTAANVRAMFDRQSAAGGLVMAAAETELGGWSGRVPAMRLPRVQWRGGRAWGVLAAAMLFVAISFALPQRMVTIRTDRSLDISDQANQLNEQIEVLAEQEIIDQTKADELKEKLEQVKADATADNPVKTWEALDHLKDTLSKSADRAAEQSLAQTQKLTESQALAEAMQQDQQANDPQMSDELNAAAMSHLSDLLKQMQQNSKPFEQAMSKHKLDPNALAPNESKQMRQVFTDQSLDPQTQQKIREALSKLGLNPEHVAPVDRKTLDELHEALKDQTLDKAEREALRQQLAKHEMNKSQLSPLTDEQLKQVEKALRELGLSDEQFALVPGDEAGKLTSEQQKQLHEMMKGAQTGKKFRQVYLREGLDARTVLKAHLSLAKVQMQHHQQGMLERAGTELMWQLATKTLDKAQADAEGPLFSPDQLDTAVGLMNQAAPETFEQMKQLGQVDDASVEDVSKMIGQKLPSAAEVGKALDAVDPKLLAEAIGQVAAGAGADTTAWNAHVGMVDSWAIEELWRLLADEWLPDDEMDMLETKLEPHQLPAAQLPTLNDEALRQINTAFKNIGLSEDDFALLPPPQRLTPEQMQQLAAAAGACNASKLSLRARMAKLENVKLIDAKMLEKMKKAGECDSSGLAAFLAENCNSMSMSQMLSGIPGRGGITRGRGDAAMTWKDPASEQGARFQEQMLPTDNLEALKNSDLVGVSLGAPEVTEAKAATSSSALANTTAGGGSASKQTLLPRHRAAVQQYFKRE